MKFDIKQKEQVFEPVTFTLTLETPAELCSFLARLGVPGDMALNDYCSGYKTDIDANLFFNFWNKLYDIAIDRGLKEG